MTTITATFNGNPNDLKMFQSTGLTDYSSNSLSGNQLKVSWIFEEPDYEKALDNCMDCINIENLEYWSIELNSIS